MNLKKFKDIICKLHEEHGDDVTVATCIDHRDMGWPDGAHDVKIAYEVSKLDYPNILSEKHILDGIEEKWIKESDVDRSRKYLVIFGTD